MFATPTAIDGTNHPSSSRIRQSRLLHDNTHLLFSIFITSITRFSSKLNLPVTFNGGEKKMIVQYQTVKLLMNKLLCGYYTVISSLVKQVLRECKIVRNAKKY